MAGIAIILLFAMGPDESGWQSKSPNARDAQATQSLDSRALGGAASTSGLPSRDSAVRRASAESFRDEAESVLRDAGQTIGDGLRGTVGGLEDNVRDAWSNGRTGQRSNIESRSRLDDGVDRAARQQAGQTRRSQGGMVPQRPPAQSARGERNTGERASTATRSSDDLSAPRDTWGRIQEYVDQQPRGGRLTDSVNRNFGTTSTQEIPGRRVRPVDLADRAPAPNEPYREASDDRRFAGRQADDRLDSARESSLYNERLEPESSYLDSNRRLAADAVEPGPSLEMKRWLDSQNDYPLRDTEDTLSVGQRADELMGTTGQMVESRLAPFETVTPTMCGEAVMRSSTVNETNVWSTIVGGTIVNWTISLRSSRRRNWKKFADNAR